MILQESRLARQAGSDPPSLFSQARDAVLLSLANNSQESLDAPLLDRLGLPTEEKFVRKMTSHPGESDLMIIRVLSLLSIF